MTEIKNIINALPLLADALGRKYGIKVQIGGNRAFTDGKNIHLPALPLDSDETILNLARGYLDHEAAHLRLTDFDALNKAELTSIEKHVWNILEDFVVERKMSAIYSGCKQNFILLIKHLFLKEFDTENEQQNSPADEIFDWLLIYLRSLAASELENERKRLEDKLEHNYPALLYDLKPLVNDIPDKCSDTASCIVYAKKIVELLGDYAENQQQQQSQNSPHENEQKTGGNSNDKNHASTGSQNNNDADNVEDNCEACECSSENIESESDNSIASTAPNTPADTLKQILDNPSSLKDTDIGIKAGKILESMGNDKYTSNLTVAVELPYKGMELSRCEITEIRQKTSALRTRLDGMLQSKVLSRNHAGHTGKMDYKRISRLATANPRIFARRSEKQGINTAVHILLDASSSMRSNNKITLACHACYAVACALTKIPDVSVAVTSFPNGIIADDGCSDKEATSTVASILAPQDKFHNRFCVYSSGGTPMAEALWWVLQQMRILKEYRKIVLILSDGEPDNFEEAQNAIEAHRNCGHEVYGIGIATSAMNRLMEDKNCNSLYDLRELAQVMFETLQTSLLKSTKSK